MANTATHAREHFSSASYGKTRHLLYAVCRCAQPLSEACLPKLAPCHEPVEVFLRLESHLQYSNPSQADSLNPPLSVLA